MKKYIILIILSLSCWVSIYAQTPQKMTYVYDALNRLTEVTYPNGSKITYNYDVLGNRNSVVIISGCALPTAVLTGTQTITAGQTANISVALTGVAPWSIVMNGTTYTANASPFSISVNPIITTTYSLTSVNNSCGAGTVSGSAVVTINACNVSPPIYNGNPRVCGSGFSWQLQPSGCTGGTLNWYDVATGGTSISSGSYFNTPAITSTTNYYVDCTIGACTSTRKTITITYYPATSPPSILPVTINNNQTATLTATNCIGGTVKWYNSSSGGTLLFTGVSYTSPTLITNTTYFASCTQGFCGSPTRASGIVTVNCLSMQTTKTGNWNDITVWSCGRVPTSTDIITIKQNHIITIPANYTANAKNVNYETGGRITEGANTSKLCLSCPQIPTNGLVLYLPLDDNANDASGNNNNGVVSGATLGNDRFGVANKAYRFNDGNRINVTNSASLSLTNAFTFSVWVNMQSNTGRDGNGAVSTTPQQCLFTKNCDNGQIRSSISPQSNGTYILQTYANAGDQLAIPFQLNQWKHIVSTYDGTTLKQFVDGVLVTTKPVVLSLALSNSYNLVIGNMGCYVYYFNGFMDEFRMYNRGLSNSEVLDIYNAEKP